MNLNFFKFLTFQGISSLITQSQLLSETSSKEFEKGKTFNLVPIIITQSAYFIKLLDFLKSSGSFSPNKTIFGLIYPQQYIHQDISLFKHFSLKNYIGYSLLHQMQWLSRIWP
ncbi:hypothetical protein IMG5_182330 [Ichthyophthirius multifiliis]|uniref:Uncharacterized protein n=1 Tax=Ichthyophthirius multifiliis TaxID=5932 RepID=G0R317_ICHMU|nr:hypothetical protein IMG5_182330 [Ichthyophthirius multifiliis]EGR28149.1 hypothetical protein IMG5_182330 [Ichthyophthirius multifiliis]|eukprot:XP_004027494.1 hypothetical protein IMG5_182330 [Ichthyophthirius multifiliis]